MRLAIEETHQEICELLDMQSELVDISIIFDQSDSYVHWSSIQSFKCTGRTRNLITVDNCFLQIVLI
jgi:acetaldehyde dehydrogenase (acetylating)